MRIVRHRVLTLNSYHNNQRNSQHFITTAKDGARFAAGPGRRLAGAPRLRCEVLRVPSKSVPSEFVRLFIRPVQVAPQNILQAR